MSVVNTQQLEKTMARKVKNTLTFDELCTEVQKLQDETRVKIRVRKQVSLIHTAKLQKMPSGDDLEILTGLLESQPETLFELWLSLASRYADTKKPKGLTVKLVPWIRGKVSERLLACSEPVDLYTLLRACREGKSDETVAWVQQAASNLQALGGQNALIQVATLFYIFALLSADEETIAQAGLVVTSILTPTDIGLREQRQMKKEARAIVVKLLLSKKPTSDARRLDQLMQPLYASNEQLVLLLKQHLAEKHDLQDANKFLVTANSDCEQQIARLEAKITQLNEYRVTLQEEIGALTKRYQHNEAFHKRELGNLHSSLVNRIDTGLAHEIGGVRTTLERIPEEAAALIEHRLANMEWLVQNLREDK